MIFLKGSCLNFVICFFVFGSIWMASNKEALVKADTKNAKPTTESTNGRPSSEQDDPDDPYMNYLFHPRLTFSGTFQSDVSTVNNIPSNFDSANFVQTNYLTHGQLWNSRGTGEWNVDASVTQVCYVNGTCVADNNEEEPILEATFQEGGNETIGKMVDLDTEAQMFSEIWGWRLRIGDFFSADFTPVPFQYIWPKIVDPGTLSPFGSAYQSVLSNIRWIDDNANSPLIEEWKKIMKSDNVESDKLSIRFNVDMYELDPQNNNFTYGRVTGSIGLLGIKSPPFFSHGRMLHAKSPNVQNAPFIVDKKKKKAYIDFGNSLQITRNGSFDTMDLNNLYVGLPLDLSETSLNITCDNKFVWLGIVNQTAPNWYRNYAGIQSFPVMRAFSEREINMLGSNPFVVVKVTGEWPALVCKEIVLAEDIKGFDIHPYDDWTMHKEPEESVNVRVIATKFGEPLPNVKVHFEANDCPNIFADGPPVAVPPIPPPEDVLTNSEGIAEFKIMTKDPKSPRDYIDGQLYPYTYSINNEEHPKKNFSLMCKIDMFELLNNLIVIAVWDQYGPVSEPTWLDHVYPIFKQYANLYPVMTENIVDLGNYYEVTERKKAIQMSMELPISHPNYMPVTRDLSPSKSKVILDWLKKDDPPTGKPKDYYTVENLRRDLQTALQLEQATIPPYLTALASIKYNYNEDVQSILRSIVIQEMMHMNLVANILNAVGGSPIFHSKDFVPFYPSRLPGGIQPDLVVPIEKVSINLIRNVFMTIEQPGVTQERKSSFNSMFDFVEKLKCSGASKYSNQESCIVKHQTSEIVDPLIDEDYVPCLVQGFEEDSIANFKLRQYGMSRSRANKKDKDSKNKKFFPNYHYEYERHHNTIGDFYNHILNSLGYLTDCGKNNSIFTGDPNRQVDFTHWSVHGRSLNVTDFVSAVEAIKLIVEQGEGSSPCNPMAWSNGTVKDLSHYFLFYSIAEKREIQVFNKHHQEGTGTDQSTKVNYEGCNGTYFFTGPKIPFDPDGVWPMVPNPKMNKFKEGTKAYLRADKFNKIYTKMLKSLENVFNGHPESLKDALGLMFSVNLHLKKLVSTPIDPDGDPDVGPNAGPPYDFVP